MTNYKQPLIKAVLGLIAGLLLATALLPSGASAHDTPTCTLSANPDAIVEGESTLLSWTTTNATDISINSGVGDVNSSGSESVSPSNTTTYTLTATNSTESVTCTETVTVLAESALPTCSFSADPNNITYNGQTTLEWETLGADYVHINNGIGYVNREDSMVLTGFQDDMTYQLIATNQNGSKTCSVTVNVDDDDNDGGYLAPTCQLSAQPTSVSYNGSVILNWTSYGASSASIDNGVGIVQKNGSKVVEHIDKTTTFKLTVTNEHGSNKCNVTVYLDTYPQGPAPTCTIEIDPDSVSYAGNAVLTWHAYHANSAQIDNGIGSVPPTGSSLISPSESSTYTMTVQDPLGRIGYCDETVTVRGGNYYIGGGNIYGGGYGTGYQGYQPPQYQTPVTYGGHTGSYNTISLGSIPYTGASDVLYVLLMLLIATGSGYGAYVLGRELV